MSLTPIGVQATLKDRLVAAAVLKASGKAVDALMGPLVGELNREGAPLVAYSWTSTNGETEHDSYFLHKAAHTISKILITLKTLELVRAVLVNDPELVRRLKELPEGKAMVMTRRGFSIRLMWS